MSIIAKGNSIAISGALPDLRSVGCASLLALASGGPGNIVLDFSELSVTSTDEMLPFICQCRSFLAKMKIDILLPKSDEVRRLFFNSNWAHLISPHVYEKSDFKSPTHLPAEPFRDSTQASSIVDALIDRLMGTLQGFPVGGFAALEWALYEIVDNVVNHAESDDGGIVQLTLRTKPLMVELVVCDSGIGIPRSLRTTRPGLSDIAAVRSSINEGVTRGTGQGNGLFGTFRMAELSGGFFNILSGMSELQYASSAVASRRQRSYRGNNASKGNAPLLQPGLHVRTRPTGYRGTFVSCGINPERAELLEDALSFKGVRHVPYSRIERLIEFEGEQPIALKLQAEVPSCGLRELARPLRIKVENLLAAGVARVSVDAEGVSIMSSSFADELFGKLCLTLGEEKFSRKIELRSANTVIRQIIDRAIRQRLATG